MSTNDKKDKNEELFDHIIEYGASSWADDISPDDIPEEDLSDQLNQKMDNMFSSARKRANRKRRFITARRIAAVFVVLLTMASITVMSVDAFREPVLNFILKEKKHGRSTVHFEPNDKDPDFTMTYIPTGYQFTKKTVSDNGDYFIYEYKNKNDQQLYIEINYDINPENYVNIDKTGYIEFVHSNTKYYFLKGPYNQLLWYKNKCIYKVYSLHSQKELLKIAIGIKY